MKSVEVGKESLPESKAKRFGFGYEKKSANSPSTQTARTEFLSLILETKPTVVFNLFLSSYVRFSELLANSEGVIADICEKVGSETPEEAYILHQPKYIRERAIKRFIPNWRSLQKIEGANLLREALGRWAQEHNLTDDWCLDRALAFLRCFEGADDRNLALALLSRNRGRALFVRLDQKSLAVGFACTTATG